MTELVVKILPMVFNFLSNWGRKPKTITVEKVVDRIEYVDREKIINVEVEKIKEVEVLKVVEKIVNLSKIEFEQCQSLLESIMNKGYREMNKIKNNKIQTVMACGPSGSGKSTILNKIFGTNFIIKKSTSDVTNEISNIVFSTSKDTQCIDTVGFLPTLSNIGKFFLLMFHLGTFPDYLLFPISQHRIADLLPLQNLITSGFIQLLIVPFSSNTYHSNIELLLKRNQGLNNNQNLDEIEKLSTESSFDKSLVNEIDTFLSAVGMSNNAKSLKSFENYENNPFSNNKSMKQLFFSLFFDKNGNFINMTFEQYQNDLLKQDQNTTIAIIYGLLIDAIKILPTHATLNRERTEIISINQCNFLKG